MNILILGATGFIGTWVTKELVNTEHQLFCAVKNSHLAKNLFPNATVFSCDFRNEQQLDFWLARLAKINIIINCVGLFYHRIESIIWRIHYETPRTIYEAAERLNIQKIIHFSALGIEHYDNPYAESKRAIENYLSQLRIPTVILKPSLVYGPGSKGGIALLRGLAALPVILPLPGKGLQCFQPIHVFDLAKAVKSLTVTSAHKTFSLAAVSTHKMTLKAICIHLKQWLGIKNNYFLSIPMSWIKRFAWFGNFFSYSLMNTAAIKMLEQGNTTSTQKANEFKQVTGVRPSNFKEGLYRTPATEADRWHAKLYFLKPLLRFSLAFMWLMSAVTSAFWFEKNKSYALLTAAQIPDFLQAAFLYGASFLNAVIGVWLLANLKIKLNCLIQLIIMSLYSFIITIKLPFLWLEPFGPIVKNIPLVATIYILYCLE